MDFLDLLEWAKGNDWNGRGAGSPLYPILNEINKAAKEGLPFLAIAMCVALPDICASLASADGRSVPHTYKAWCKNNLGAEFSFVTPDDLYSMRCGVLHNGRFGDLKHNVGRIIFALPGGSPGFVNCVANDAYVYSVVDFCKHFTDAVFKWFEANKNDANIQANIPRLMQYRVGGFAPYFHGLTVLA